MLLPLLTAEAGCFHERQMKMKTKKSKLWTKRPRRITDCVVDDDGDEDEIPLTDERLMERHWSPKIPITTNATTIVVSQSFVYNRMF